MTGYVVGLPLGFATGVAILKGIVLLSSAWHIFFPLRPDCSAGKCRSNGYNTEIKTGHLIYTCKCGKSYMRDGRKFIALMPDGSKHPYKRLDRWGRWVDDQ
jgi:hypothetical protein